MHKNYLLSCVYNFNHFNFNTLFRVGIIMNIKQPYFPKKIFCYLSLSNVFLISIFVFILALSVRSYSLDVGITMKKLSSPRSTEWRDVFIKLSENLPELRHIPNKNKDIFLFESWRTGILWGQDHCNKRAGEAQETLYQLVDFILSKNEDIYAVTFDPQLTVARYTKGSSNLIDVMKICSDEKLLNQNYPNANKDLYFLDGKYRPDSELPKLDITNTDDNSFARIFLCSDYILTPMKTCSCYDDENILTTLETLFNKKFQTINHYRQHIVIKGLNIPRKNNFSPVHKRKPIDYYLFKNTKNIQPGTQKQLRAIIFEKFPDQYSAIYFDKSGIGQYLGFTTDSQNTYDVTLSADFIEGIKTGCYLEDGYYKNLDIYHDPTSHEIVPDEIVIKHLLTDLKTLPVMATLLIYAEGTDDFENKNNDNLNNSASLLSVLPSEIPEPTQFSKQCLTHISSFYPTREISDYLENFVLKTSKTKSTDIVQQQQQTIKAKFEKTTQLDPQALTNSLSEEMKPLKDVADLSKCIFDETSAFRLAEKIKELNNFHQTVKIVALNEKYIPSQEIEYDKTFDVFLLSYSKDKDAIDFINTAFPQTRKLADNLKSFYSGKGSWDEFSIDSREHDLINRFYWCSDSIMAADTQRDPDYKDTNGEDYVLIKFINRTNISNHTHVKRINLTHFPKDNRADFPGVGIFRQPDNHKNIRAITLVKETGNNAMILIRPTGIAVYMNFSVDNISFYNVELSREFAQLIKHGIYEKEGLYKELAVEIQEPIEGLNEQEQEELRNWLLSDLKSIPVMCHHLVYYKPSNFETAISIKLPSIQINSNMDLSKLCFPEPKEVTELDKISSDFKNFYTQSYMNFLNIPGRIKKLKQKALEHSASEKSQGISCKTQELFGEIKTNMTDQHHFFTSCNFIIPTVIQQFYNKLQEINIDEHTSETFDYQTLAQDLENHIYGYYMFVMMLIERKLLETGHLKKPTTYK